MALLDPYTQLALVTDGEEDMHAFLRNMEACQALDQRGIAGKGKLDGRSTRTHPEYVALRERVDACERAQAKNTQELDHVHQQATLLLQRYSDYVRLGRKEAYFPGRQTIAHLRRTRRVHSQARGVGPKTRMTIFTCTLYLHVSCNVDSIPKIHLTALE